jgi:SAM-dependent methyltransferase
MSMAHDEPTAESSRTESQYYAFRGFDRANAEAVLSFYPALFADGPVLELACGPGVFLDLLAAAGVEASGVDLDPGMVEQARQRGHRVALGDALAHLRAVPDGGLGGLFAAHFLEHLQAEVVGALYREAARALRPGGVFVAVTPNAACLSVLGYDFWRDPTHVRFYDPMALAFFAGEAGLEVTGAGGNPRNHPGAPPQLHTEPAAALGDLRQDLQSLVTEVNDELPQPRIRDDAVRDLLTRTALRLVHLVGVLDDRFQRMQHDLGAYRAAYESLLAQLYPSNETYVIARRPAAGSPAGEAS